MHFGSTIYVQRKCIFLILTLALVFSLFEVVMAAGAGSNDDELIGSLKTKISSNPEDWNSRWELARIYFNLAGFTKYCQEKSWLWTEPSFKRTELNKKLAPIFPQPSISCQQQLLQILDRNPEQPPALIMAGYYHDSINQKEIALWYFRRALALTPGSVEANTALADFYLDEWQPAEVLQLLNRFNSPELILRKGIAEIQLGQYQLALGYLLQADPLPPEWQITKNLNLAKAYLALGDCNHFNALLNQGSSIQEIIPATLFQELSGWAAFWGGDIKQANTFWDQGRKINPEYYFWQSNQLASSPVRFGSTRVTPIINFSQGKENNFINSVARILQGQERLAKGDLESASRAFISGIKSDHFSLIGFLKAGDVQSQAGQNERALDLYNRGLAINSKFLPLLKKRAEVYQKLGCFDEAAKDREAIRSNAIIAPNSASKLQFVPAWEEGDKLACIIYGNTRNLIGLWFSRDGEVWEWLPWWGGPFYIDPGVKHCWLVPIGAGLAGEAYFLDNVAAETIPIEVETPQILDDQVIFKFSQKVKLVLTIDSPNYITISYISDQLGQSHSIPAKLFHQGDQVLECWLQTERGEWRRVQLNFLFPNQELPAVVISQNTDDIHGNEPKPETNPPKLTYI